MSPSDRSGGPASWVSEVGRIHTFTGLPDILKGHIQSFRDWLLGMNDSLRSRIAIRLFPTIPTSSVVLIDKDLDDGLIKVEGLLFKVPPDFRPSYIVRRQTCPDLFERLVDMFNQLWDESIDIHTSG
jgi:hypothetical protein